MSGFEDSAEYKAARAAYEQRQKMIDRAQSFMQGARSLYSSMSDWIAANAIEDKKNVRSAGRKVLKGLENLGYGIKNKAEDVAYDTGEKLKSVKSKAKGLFNKMAKWGQDKIDTAHYGLLVTKDGLAKATKPVIKVSKAAVHGLAMVEGATLGIAVKAGERGIKAVKKVSLDGLKKFVSKAKSLYSSMSDKVAANAIENKKMVRSARRSITEGLKNLGYGMKNKAEDVAYDTGEKLKSVKSKAKGLFNKMTKWGQGKIDTAHYGLLVAKDGIAKWGQDKIDTAHYGLLVAKDGLTKATKPVKKIAKAAAHGFAMAAGTALWGAEKAGEKVATGATKVMQGAENLKNAALDKVADGLQKFDNATQKLNDGINNGINWVGNKAGQIKDVSKKELRNFVVGAAVLYKVESKVLSDKAKELGSKASRYMEEKKHSMGEKWKSAKSFGKGLFNKMTKWGKDKADTAQQGLLVAKDGLAKATKPVKKIAKATAHSFAMAAGTALWGAEKAGEKVATGATKVMQGAENLKNAALDKVADGLQKFDDVTQKLTDNINDGINRVGDKAGQLADKSMQIVKVNADKARAFMSDKKAKITIAGKNFGKNIINAMRTGGERAYSAVSNTMTSVGRSINNGIETTKENINTASRGNSAAWFRMGYASARRSR